MSFLHPFQSVKAANVRWQKYQLYLKLQAIELKTTQNVTHYINHASRQTVTTTSRNGKKREILCYHYQVYKTKTCLNLFSVFESNNPNYHESIINNIFSMLDNELIRYNVLSGNFKLLYFYTFNNFTQYWEMMK